MTRKFLCFALVSTFVLATASRGGAATISDVFDPADQLFGKQSDGVCVGNNVTDTITGTDANGCGELSYLIQLVGYNQPPDTLTSATLSLTLYDDKDSGKAPETVIVTLDGDLQGTFSIANSPFMFNVFANVQPDGMLTVLLQRGAKGGGQADFYFDKGVLNAEWQEGGGIDTSGDPTVPEPATMFLMSSGLGSMAYRRWRSKKA